jgi:cytoskeletal protein CcmA (bactofilin family)
LTQLQEARAAAAVANIAAQPQSQPFPPPMPDPNSAASGISIVPKGPMYLDGETPSVIGEDLTIEGQAITIRCKGALEINGKIHAELHSQKLVVGKSGRVEGTIAAESVEIWGMVSGTIMGSRVTLHPSAEVEGDIHAKSLSVADGASFEGRSRKVTDTAAIAPRLEPGSPSTNGATTLPIPIPVQMPSQLAS